MTPSDRKKMDIEGKGLRYKLLIIQALIFVLPFLVVAYYIYKNNVALNFTQLGVLALILSLVLVGLMILRQIFDRLLTVTTLMKRAVAGDGDLADIQQGLADIQKDKEDKDEVHEMVDSFDSLMTKFGDTTSELNAVNKKLAVAFSHMRTWKVRLDTAMFGEEVGFLLDEDGHILGITEKTMESTGRSRFELLGKNILDLVVDDESGKELKEDIKKAPTGVFRRVFVNMITKESGHQQFMVKLMRMSMEKGGMILALIRESTMYTPNDTE